MKHRWAALLVVLACSALAVRSIVGQGTATPPTSSQRAAGSLGRNFPNPFNPTTTIPFSIGMQGDPPVCADPSRQHRVTLRIYNILSQLIATPIIQGGDKGGEPIERVALRCGTYTAWWDGTVTKTGQTVSSGTYIYVLEVDGQKTSKQMLVAK